MDIRLLSRPNNDRITVQGLISFSSHDGGEEEPTKNYIKLVLAPQMGQGIMPNTVGESQVISFLPREHMRGRASAGVVIVSVCLSHAWIVTKLNDALQIF